jgi:phage/plasmid-like protein (TIGR03299 family)
MAHEIEMVNGSGAMFSVRKEPWHFNETRSLILEAAPKTAAEAIRLAKADWSVSKRPLFFSPSSEHQDRSIQEAAEYKIMIRDTDNKPLGIVSNNYVPLQNIEAFEWFDSFVQTGLADFETAGVLCGGRKVWVLAKVNGGTKLVGGKDPVDQYILLANGHDGATSIMTQLTPIRVVCNNTLQASLSRAFVNKRMHVGDLKKTMADLKATMGLIQSEFAIRFEVFDAMYAKAITMEQFEAYLAIIVLKPDIPLTKEPNAIRSWELVCIKQDHRRDRIRHLYIEGAGHEMHFGKVWGAYNAAVEYADYELATSRVKDFANYVLYGYGQAFKARAYSEAVKLLS